MTFPVFIKASRSRISVAKEIREVNRLRTRYERSMTSRLMGVFKKVGREAAKEYKQSGRVSAALVPLKSDLEKVFNAHYTAVIKTFSDRVYDTRKYRPFTDLVFAFIEKEGGNKIRGITATTGRQILQAITAGEKDGEGVDAIAKRIVDKTSGAIGRSRAATIARTETHAAASYATHTATKELDLPAQKKRWVSVSDGRTRDHHRSANGQEVGIDEKFVIRYRGTEILMEYPHDGSGGAANNVNCRCLAIYFTDEDALFDSFDDFEEVDEVLPVAGDSGQVKPSPPPVAPKWGDDLDQEEIDYHEQSWKVGTTATMLSVIRKTRKVKTIEYDQDGAYALQGYKIAMKNKRGVDVNGTSDAGLWRHEYGHHVDYNGGLVGVEVARPYASRQLVPVMSKDRLSLNAARQKKANLVYSEEVGDFFEPLSIDDFTGDGSAVVKKKINDLLKDTGLTRADLNAFVDPRSVSGSSTKILILEQLRFLFAVKHRYFSPNMSRLLSYKWTREFEGPNFADYLGAITNEAVGWGHGKAYYRKFPAALYGPNSETKKGFNTSHTTEAMANYFALMGSENAKSWRKLMDIFAPETTKGFDKLLEDLDDRLE